LSLNYFVNYITLYDQSVNIRRFIAIRKLQTSPISVNIRRFIAIRKLQTSPISILKGDKGNHIILQF